MDDATKAAITENIRRLVRARGNIAHVCRRLGVNRQQFNKYLAGQHLPSQYNLNLICQFFGVTYAEIITPGMEIPESRHPSEYLEGYRVFERSALLQDVIRLSDRKRLAAFEGVYCKYHYSSIYRGDVVRAVTVIRPMGDLYAYTNLERFPNKNNPKKHDYVFKYHGFVFMLDGRIFMTDLEKLQKNEITFSIYTPIARNPMRFFFGVTGGVASNLYREPYVSRSVLDFMSPGLPTRAHYRHATVVTPDDPTIPVEALEYLNG
jgi:transcriptional regulator with XRE-family HTH domain